MPIHFRRLSLLLLTLVFAGSARAQTIQSALPSDRELSRYGLVRAWWNRATIAPHESKVQYITVDEQAVYVQSTKGIVSTFDSESGKLMWSRLIGSPQQNAFPAVTNDDFVLIASGMKVYAIHKATGTDLWTITLPHHASASPEVDQDQVYIGMVDGSVYAYDLKEVSRLYQERLLPEYLQMARVWHFRTPTEIVSPPVSNGSSVAFASFSGLLFSVHAKRDNYGRTAANFQFETEGRAPIRVPVGRNNDTIFVASDDARVFALDITRGVRKWSFTAGAPIRLAPRVIGNQVFVAPSRRGVYCLRANTGFQQWHQAAATDVLAATPDLVYASDNLDNVLLMDREDGAILGTLPLRGLPNRVHNERTDRLYLASDDGLIVCIREKDRELPLWHMFPERQPLRPEFAPDEAAPANGESNDSPADPNADNAAADASNE